MSIFQSDKTPLEFILDLYPTIPQDFVEGVLQYNHYDLVNTFAQIEKCVQLQEEEDHTLVDENNNNTNSNSNSSSGRTSYSGVDQNSNSSIPVVCKYFLTNTCTDINCKFQHILPEGMIPAAVAPVCKYFINEGCRIRNCPFRHSAETVVCKYWILGTCNKGDSCLFSHQISETLENMNNLSIYQQDSITTPPPPPPKLPPGPPPTTASTDDFPVLGASKSQFPPLGGGGATNNSRNQPIRKERKKPKNNNNNNNNNTNNKNIVHTPIVSNPTLATNNQQQQQQNSPASEYIEIFLEEQDPFPTLGANKQTKKKKIVYKNDTSFQLQVKQLQDKFHHVNQDTVMKEFLLCDQNVVNTTHLLITKYGTPVPKVQKPSMLNNNNNNNNNNDFREQKKVNSNDNINIDWVETGVDISILYETHREEAIREGRERNKCFSLATNAYLNHDSASAKAFSQKGREHDEKMKELNQKAMDLIFYERNQNYIKEGKNVIDLHGLHVLEAIEILQDYLVKLPLYVIVGTGHHTGQSGSQAARLPKKIKEYLSENNYRFCDVSDDRRGGLIKVER
ncbi:hypothetical protein CYY_007336 [Polysphondylium violaceum]|uniref:CCCH-type zinc finger-containing protein n=1 Tax=Polysphondylium violaceum TaxID=133409 RepID=A0A8J4UY28_9MYCE|nr:hypothetical protein CYY_007336 [Polysphondylium violaceum]